MNPEQKYGEFGPIGHENGLPKAPEFPTQTNQEAGILPDDPESKKALIRLNKLRAEGADAESIRNAENAVADAAQAEQQQAAEAARADIARIHSDTQHVQPSAEQTTPDSVHTLEGSRQKPVVIHTEMQPKPTPKLTIKQLQGDELAELVRRELQNH